MNVFLTPELEAMVQEKIGSGMYANADEVIREALRRMNENDPYRELKSFFAPRITEAAQKNYSEKSFDEIIATARQSAKSE